MLYDASKDQEVNLLRAAASGAIGGFIAGEVGSFIAKKRIGQKGLSYATEGVADVIDLPELPGDITANIQQRSLRGGLRSGRVTLPPGVSYDDVIPSTLRVGKVRSPVGSIFGLGASPSQSETFGFSGPTPSTSFSTTRTAPSPITVPQPFSFSTTPSKIGTPAPITANIPSPISISITNPVPVPVTTQITIPNIRTPSTTNVEVPIPVPTFTPVSSNINIPVNVRDRFPFLPVSFGGGRGTKGKTKSNVGKGSTKTIFQSIFSGVDLSKITVKKGKEQTGLLLRG